ncbi:MAG TPA: SusD/RagB family nutrient-binding outer membrane lipoprotein, partial [Phnomibacter sp.]|nr:SusD/RagB family nutrient-binding outer membrane lipoprotein [Phnomibacter sp.]
MKNFIKFPIALSMAGIMFASCKKFDEINTDPLAANSSQVQVEYFINNSIIGAQMDPHIAERVFILYWKTAGRQQLGGGISTGGYNDGWTSDYYSSGYLSGWLNNITTAIQVADEKLASGNAPSYTNNLKQVARIWRAYLMSEMTDNFGPIPLNGFQGVNPEFSDVKTVYYFMLDELKDAVAKLDVGMAVPQAVSNHDPAYSYNFDKWRRYANSMRMRLAMRLSEVDAAKAKSEFEAAAAGSNFITAADQTFQIAERPGWDALTGVMTREWNAQIISATLNNLYLGLGGIRSADQVRPALQSAIKPANYMGLKLTNHFTTLTNDPSAGYWLDGLPHAIDPRAYKAFIIPGDFEDPNFNKYPSWANDATTTVRSLVDAAGAVVKTIDAKYHWNAGANGDWGVKGSRNQLRAFSGTM